MIFWGEEVLLVDHISKKKTTLDFIHSREALNDGIIQSRRMEGRLFL